MALDKVRLISTDNNILIPLFPVLLKSVIYYFTFFIYIFLFPRSVNFVCESDPKDHVSYRHHFENFVFDVVLCKIHIQISQYLFSFCNKKYLTVGIIPKANTKIAERGNSDTLTYKYMTAHFPGLVQAGQ